MIHRMLSRKTLLGIAMTIAAGLSLAACGGGGGGGGASPPPPPPPPVSRTPQKAVFMAEDTTLGQRHLYAAGDEGGDLTPLTTAFANPDGDVSAYALSPDGRTVAFSADAEIDGEVDLYLIDTNGGTPIKVDTGFPVNTPINRLFWSPDSSQVAYVANPQGRAARGFALYEVFLVDRDGSNNRKINGPIGSPAVVSVSNPIWSPDSRYVLQTVKSLDPFQVDIGYNIYDTSVGAPNSTRVSPALDWRNGESLDSRAVWDSTSTRIIYKSDFETNNVTRLYSTAVDGSGTVRLNGPLTSGGDVYSFQLSPDGRSVAYIADQVTDRRFDLFVRELDGTSVSRLTASLGSNRVPTFAWSPDSTRIAFDDDRTTANVRELYVANVDGSSTTRVSRPLASGQYARLPTWSPDGRSLAFVSDQEEPGRAELYAVEADGSNERRMSRNDAGGGFGAKVWSPDSTMLAYAASQEDRSVLELFVAPADGSANMKINAELGEDEEVLSSSVAWSDDGTRIIFSDYYYEVFSSRWEYLDLWIGTTDGAAPIMINDTFDYNGLHSY